MTIDGLQTVLMSHNHVEAVATALKASQTHAARKCRVNGIANGCTQVNSLVCATELGTITIVRGHIVALNRHHIVANVKHLGVRHIGILIAVDEIAVPTLGIDIGLGFAFFI